MSDRWPWGPPPLPAGVRVTRGEPLRVLNLSALEPAAKRRHWAAIRDRRPALAALLEDTDFQALAAAFDADVCVHLEDLPDGGD